MADYTQETSPLKFPIDGQLWDEPAGTNVIVSLSSGTTFEYLPGGIVYTYESSNNYWTGGMGSPEIPDFEIPGTFPGLEGEYIATDDIYIKLSTEGDGAWRQNVIVPAGGADVDTKWDDTALLRAHGATVQGSVRHEVGGNVVSESYAAYVLQRIPTNEMKPTLADTGWNALVTFAAETPTGYGDGGELTYVYGTSDSPGDVKISTPTAAEQALPTTSASAIPMKKGDAFTIKHTSVNGATATTTTTLTFTDNPVNSVSDSTKAILTSTTAATNPTIETPTITTPVDGAADIQPTSGTLTINGSTYTPLNGAGAVQTGSTWELTKSQLGPLTTKEITSVDPLGRDGYLYSIEHREHPSDRGSTSLKVLCWMGDRWYAMIGDVEARMVTSTDGITWDDTGLSQDFFNNPSFPHFPESAAYDEATGTLVVCMSHTSSWPNGHAGLPPNMQYSTNKGQSFTGGTIVNLADPGGGKANFNNGKYTKVYHEPTATPQWLAVCTPQGSSFDTFNFATSSDGKTWYQHQDYGMSGGLAGGVAWVANKNCWYITSGDISRQNSGGIWQWVHSKPGHDVTKADLFEKKEIKNGLTAATNGNGGQTFYVDGRGVYVNCLPGGNGWALLGDVTAADGGLGSASSSAGSNAFNCNFYWPVTSTVSGHQPDGNNAMVWYESSRDRWYTWAKGSLHVAQKSGSTTPFPGDGLSAGDWLDLNDDYKAIGAGNGGNTMLNGLRMSAKNDSPTLGYLFHNYLHCGMVDPNATVLGVTGDPNMALIEGGHRLKQNDDAATGWFARNTEINGSGAEDYVTVSSGTGTWTANAGKRIVDLDVTAMLPSPDGDAGPEYGTVTGSPFAGTPGALTQTTIPEASLEVSSKYYVRTQYSTTNTAAATSEWSDWSEFNTADKFLPTIGDLYGGGRFVGQINDGGEIYNIIQSTYGQYGKMYGKSSWAPGNGWVAGNAGRTYGGQATQDIIDTAVTANDIGNIINNPSGMNSGAYNKDNPGYDWYLPAIDELEICMRYGTGGKRSYNASTGIGSLNPFSGKNDNAYPTAHPPYNGAYLGNSNYDPDWRPDPAPGNTLMQNHYVQALISTTDAETMDWRSAGVPLSYSQQWGTHTSTVSGKLDAFSYGYAIKLIRREKAD